MDSQFMDAGTYAWIVIIIFFIIFFSLQIRNCIQNVRNNNNSLTDLYPDLSEAGATCGQTRSGVYTIDVRTGAPTNFTNSGYVSTEGTVKAQSNDGLPTYEEAISGVKTPSAPPSSLQPSIELVNEDSQNGGGSSRSGGRRHRRHHRHRHHSDQQNNENAESNAPDDSRRHRHRRGFRLKRHLAKINRRNHGETE